MIGAKRFRSDSFGPDGWRFGTDWRHIRAGMVDGIADPPGAPDVSPDGRHRAYLQTWRDPSGTCRADIIYPRSTVARIEADAAANGVRVRQAYSPLCLTPEDGRAYAELGA